MVAVKDKGYVFPVGRHVSDLTDAELIEQLIELARGHWWGVDTNRLGIVKEELALRLARIQFLKQAKAPGPKDLSSTLISSPDVLVPKITVSARHVRCIGPAGNDPCGWMGRLGEDGLCPICLGGQFEDVPK
jgi:hypothetical protein